MKQPQFEWQNGEGLTQSLLSTEDELFGKFQCDSCQKDPISEKRKYPKYHEINKNQQKQGTKDTTSHISINGGVSKLSSILNNDESKDQSSHSVEQVTPKSAQTAFLIENTRPAVLRQIEKVSILDYLQMHLRKSTRGLQWDSLLKKMTMKSHRTRPMTQTLTTLGKEETIGAISLYRIVLRIGETTVLQDLLALLQKFIKLYKKQNVPTRTQLILKILLLTNHKESLFSIRMYQLLLTIVHTFTTKRETCLFLLAVIKRKLGCGDMRLNQEEYLRFLAFYLCRKLEGKRRSLQYQPIRYQLVCLILLRKIQIPCFLPAGRHILIHVQSFQTFCDIKGRVLECFGISATQKWLQSLQFSLFFQSKYTIMEEAIDGDSVCWDWFSQAYYMRQECLVANNEANMCLMLRLAFPIKFHPYDQQAIQTLFANYYLEFALSNTKYQQDRMLKLIALINAIKNQHSPNILFPIRCQQLSKSDSFHSKINAWRILYSRMDRKAQKRLFIETLNEDDRKGLGLTVSTRLHFQLRLTHNQMIYEGEDGTTLKVIEINDICRWQVEGQYLTLHFLDHATRGQVIISQQAASIASYLQRRTFLVRQGYL